MVMAATGFNAIWWPLCTAVAWVLTRNRAFVERFDEPIARPANFNISITFELSADSLAGHAIQRAFANSNDAWLALREEIVAGRIRVAGAPFCRRAALEG